MPQRYRRALFLFRRDLRLVDNTGLRAAAATAVDILPCFIFDPEQQNHPYFSVPGFQFLKESLIDLGLSIKEKGGELLLLEGRPLAVLGDLLARESIEALYFNKDYTPFALQRDRQLTALCEKRNVACHSFDDALLMPPGSILKEDGSPYTVFTPFYKKALLQMPEPPTKGNVSFVKPKTLSAGIDATQKEPTTLPGGRRAGRQLLERAAKNPLLERDDLTEPTSRLSAHLKFGTLSAREAFDALKGQSVLQRALYWRDFFTTIAWYFPQVFGAAFQEKRRNIVWKSDASLLKRWMEGTTGFPLVDAGMRELAATGFMHNRLRMVTASFLVKDMHVDWRTGEAFFARSLVDYDPCVNNGNWQWVAGTGCDHAPYFRIFNPWTQQQKFDPEAVYIKRWIPELRQLPPKRIHRLNREAFPGYPEPILDHAREAKVCLDLYRL